MVECPRPIKSRFYPTWWSSRTRPSMRIQRSEGLGSRLGGGGGGGVTPIDPVLPPATGVKTLVKWKLEQSKGQGKVKRVNWSKG